MRNNSILEYISRSVHRKLQLLLLTCHLLEQVWYRTSIFGYINVKKLLINLSKPIRGHQHRRGWEEHVRPGEAEGTRLALPWEERASVRPAIALTRELHTKSRAIISSEINIRRMRDNGNKLNQWRFWRYRKWNRSLWGQLNFQRGSPDKLEPLRRFLKQSWGKPYFKKKVLPLGVLLHLNVSIILILIVKQRNQKCPSKFRLTGKKKTNKREREEKKKSTSIG